MNTYEDYPREIVTEHTVVGEEIKKENRQALIDLEVTISCYEVVLKDLNKRHNELIKCDMTPAIKNSIGTNLVTAMNWIGFELGKMYVDYSKRNPEK